MTVQVANRAVMPLDAFGFWPRFRSCIRGLGGDDAPSEKNYAFHSSYAYSSGGPMTFRFRFAGLSASGGRLLVRVFQLQSGSSGRVQQVFRREIPFEEIVQAEGILEFGVATADGNCYAAIGNVEGEAAPSATSLELSIERTTDASDFSAKLDKARQTIFGPKATASAGNLVSQELATLADPVSQLCTSSQFDEPAYQRWIDRMALARHVHRKQWEFVYILQVLERHGMIAPGRRGIGFGVGMEQLPAVFAASGCEVVATDLPVGDARATEWNVGQQHSHSLNGLRFPAICADDVLDKNVSFRAVDMNAIPRDLAGFDFAWSACALEHLGSIAAGLRFIEKSLDCVRPGGVVVHTTEFNLTSNGKTVDRAATVLPRRRDIEGLAARLVAQGHDVAPIKYDAGEAYADAYVDVPPYTGDAQLKIALSGYVTTSIGFAVRKGERKPGGLRGFLAGRRS